jgi:hypothetical protein
MFAPYWFTPQRVLAHALPHAFRLDLCGSKETVTTSRTFQQDLDAELHACDRLRYVLTLVTSLFQVLRESVALCHPAMAAMASTLMLRPCLEFMWPPALSPEQPQVSLVACVPEGLSLIQCDVLGRTLKGSIKAGANTSPCLLSDTCQLINGESGSRCVGLGLACGAHSCGRVLQLLLSCGPPDAETAVRSVLAGGPPPPAPGVRWVVRLAAGRGRGWGVGGCRGSALVNLRLSAI